MFHYNFDKSDFFCYFKKVFYNMVVLLLVYNLLLRTRFQLDTYFATTTGYNAMNLPLGRYFTHLVEMFFFHIGINLFKINKIVLLLMLISSSILVVTITDTLHHIFLMKNKNIKFINLNIFVLVMFINIFILEILTFPDNYIFSLISLFLFTFLVKSLYIYFVENKRIYLFFFAVLTFLLVSVYQVTITFICIFSSVVIGIINDFKFNKKMIKDLIYVYGIVFFNILINVGILKVLQKFNIVSETVRDVSFTSINDKLNTIIEGSKYIWVYGCRLLPKYFLLSYLIIFLLLIVYFFIQPKYIIKQKYFLLFFIIFSILVVYSPHIITKTSWIVPRTLRSVGELISGQLIILTFVFFERKKIQIFLNYLSIIFILVNSIVINSIISDQITTNSIDKFIANTIISKIKNHEESTGDEIKKICIVSDKNPTYFDYNYIKYGDMDINRRAFSIDWAKYDAFEYYYGKKLIRVKNSDNYIKEKLNDNDWKNFNPDKQIFINNDTIYYISY